MTMNKILLGFIFCVVAAASFNGFFAKWAFLYDNERASFKYMYEGTAHRPFVYRQLMIFTAKELNENFFHGEPGFLLENFYEHDLLETHYAGVILEPEYALEYHLVYCLSAAFLLISMFLWRKIGAEISGSARAGTLAALIFALIFPLLETVGGYFYDFGELLFFSLAVFFAMRGWWLALIILAPVAEFNKESFLFFAATLFPILAAKVGKMRAGVTILTAITLCGVVYLKISALYAGNPGGTVEIHFYDHVENLLSGWLAPDFTYGLILGGGMFLPHVIFAAWIVRKSWAKLPPPWKLHVWLALAINVPLYLIFCFPGELRNLSMLYVGFLAMLAIFLSERSD